jgi:hypothetical protein
VPTYTKKIGRHDKITIDDVDVSNAFRSFGRPSEDALVPVTGFSTTGVVENLPGDRDQRFEGEAFYTEELGALVEPLYKNRTAIEITWQPDGLVDATREVYVGTCTITTWSPSNTVGDANTMSFTAVPDENGITVNDWT